jgi:hypothetical protein
VKKLIEGLSNLLLRRGAQRLSPIGDPSLYITQTINFYLTQPIIDICYTMLS